MTVNRKSKLIALLMLLMLIFPASALADSHEADVFVFGSPRRVIRHAEAKLVRDDDSVDLDLETYRVGDEHTFTVWWIIFNNPAACATTPCGPGDLPQNGGNPAVQGAGLWATGGLSDDDGELKLTAHLEENNPPGQVLPWSDPDGLLDAEGAEIHIVIRDHGPEQDGLLYAQTHTFGGGCNNTPPILGTNGNYACVDVQAAIFLP